MNFLPSIYNYLLITSFYVTFSNCRFFLPLSCQISLELLIFSFLKTFFLNKTLYFVFLLEIRGFEPLTLGLQSRCSSQLSYIPWLYIIKGKKKRNAVK